LDEGEIVGRGFVIARRDTPTLLDLVEEALDQVTGAIKVATEANWIRPVSLRRNVRPRAVLADKCSDPIGVKSTISEQHGSRFQARQQAHDKTVVVRLASGQRDTNRQATGIDDRVNLGRQPASRPAHQLFTVSSDAGSVLMHTHAQGGTINRQKSIAADANMMILLPLSGHCGHSEFLGTQRSVANDPKRTWTCLVINIRFDIFGAR
jgi:hypothetical protein